MMRREFITLLGGAAAAWPLAARAQQAGKLPTVGFLGHDYAFDHEPMDRRFCRSDCANLAGSRVAPSRSSIAGRRDAASATPRLRPSLSGLRLMSSSRRDPQPSTAKKATSVIPIVLALSGDPVGAGLVASLARPGGNVTGLSMLSADLAGKRLELLREVVPGLRRLAIMVNVGFPDAVLESGEVQAAAGTLGLEVATLEIRRARGYRARLRGTEGPRGRALCLYRRARERQPDSHQHIGARRTTTNDAWV